jgi:hypothetical protein
MSLKHNPDITNAIVNEGVSTPWPEMRIGDSATFAPSIQKDNSKILYRIRSTKDVDLLTSSDARSTLNQLMCAIRSCPIMDSYFDKNHFDRMIKDIGQATVSFQTYNRNVIAITNIPDREMYGNGYQIYSKLEVDGDSLKETVFGYDIYYLVNHNGSKQIRYGFNFLPNQREEFSGFTQDVFLGALSLIYKKYKPDRISTDPKLFQSAVGDPLLVGIFYLKKGFIPEVTPEEAMSILGNLRDGRWIDRNKFVDFWERHKNQLWSLSLEKSV